MDCPEVETRADGRGEAAAGRPPGHAGLYRYYVLVILSVVSFINYMDRSLLSVMVEPIKADLHMTDTEVGLLVGFGFAVFYAVFGIPLAGLADRTSRTRILAFCIAAWSVLTAVTGAAQTFLQLALARVGVGVGEAGCVPPSHSLLADYFPPKERSFAISVFQAGGIAGVTFGLMVAGAAAEALGWRSAFFLLGLPGLAVAAIVGLTVRETRTPQSAGARGPLGSPAETWRNARTLLANPAYLHVVLGVAIGNFAAQGLGAWTPAFFMRVHDFSVSQAGFWLGASSGVGGLVGMLLGGGLSIRLVAVDRRWEVWLPAASSAAALPLYLLTFLYPTADVALVAKFLAAFVAAFGSGAGLASIQSVTPPAMRALAVALVMFAGAFIGLGAGPFVVGLASDLLAGELGKQSLRAALVMSTGFVVWSVAHFLLAARFFPRHAGETAAGEPKAEAASQ